MFHPTDSMLKHLGSVKREERDRNNARHTFTDHSHLRYIKTQPESITPWPFKITTFQAETLNLSKQYYHITQSRERNIPVRDRQSDRPTDLLIQFMESEVQSLLHKVPPVLKSQFKVGAPWHNGNKLPTHALSFKRLNGYHL